MAFWRCARCRWAEVFDRLARGVRQVSRDLGKEVRLVITGSDTEIDKLIVGGTG